jgi:hypothetical protein
MEEETYDRTSGRMHISWLRFKSGNFEYRQDVLARPPSVFLIVSEALVV